MSLLQEFLRIIDEEFNGLQELNIKNEKDFSLVTFSDIGEKVGETYRTYQISMTFSDDTNDVIIRVAKHIQITDTMNIYKEINDLNYENSRYTYYLNKYNFIVQRDYFKASTVDDIFIHYKMALDEAKEKFTKFDFIKVRREATPKYIN